MEINKLREDYEKLTGKKPFNGWNTEKLQEHISNYAEPVDKEEAKRMAEAKAINNQSFRTIDDSLVPVMIEGVAHCLYNNKYVLYEEAEILIQKEKVARETRILKELLEGSKSPEEQTPVYKNRSEGKRTMQNVL